MENNNCAVWIARCYLILLLMINLSGLLYANVISYQIIESNSMLQAEQEQERVRKNGDSSTSNNIIDDSLKSLQPILDLGEKAKTATPIFAASIIINLTTSVLMILPKHVMKYVNKIVLMDRISMGFESLEAFFRIMLICNLCLAIFEIMGALSYWDFATAMFG